MLARAAKVLLQHIALAHRDWLPSGAMPMGHVNEAQAILHALIGEQPSSMLGRVAPLSWLLPHHRARCGAHALLHVDHWLDILAPDVLRRAAHIHKLP